MKMKTIEVEVTERNIKQGLLGMEEYCPVALAIKRVTRLRNVFVGGGVIETEKWSVKMPVKVRKFIGRFDDEKPVQPFKFTLKIRENK